MALGDIVDVDISHVYKFSFVIYILIVLSGFLFTPALFGVIAMAVFGLFLTPIITWMYVSLFLGAGHSNSSSGGNGRISDNIPSRDDVSGLVDGMKSGGSSSSGSSELEIDYDGFSEDDF